MPTLSVCLIVKNEARCLEKCLNSVKEIADEIVVVDTGSTDQTVEIARKFTDRIFFFDWCDDYSAARNAALDQATQDWILILNGDEALSPESCKLIPQKLCERDSLTPLVLLFRLLTPGEQTQYVRGLFPNHLGIRFKGRVHEWPAHDKKQLYALECSDLIVHHSPHYSSNKYIYDKALLLKDLAELTDPFERCLHYYHLGRTELKLGDETSALEAFKQARDLFFKSGAPLQQRLYHNLLAPLARLAMTVSDSEGSVKEGWAFSQELTDLFPQFIEGWLFRAYAEFWLGHLEAAERHYRKTLDMLKQSSDLPEPVQRRTALLARLGLGRIALLNQPPLRGLHELRMVYDVSPSAEVSGHLARAHLLLGDIQRAQGFYRTFEHGPCPPAQLSQRLLQLDIWSPLEVRQLQRMAA